jgi:hypothetical protein
MYIYIYTTTILPAALTSSLILSSCVSFWVIPWRLKFKYQRFGTLSLLHLHSPMKMEQTECSEVLTLKLQKLGNQQEEGIHNSEYGVSLN